MAIFEVYSSDTADQTEFISDKKPIFGLIFPALWLLWNRLWFAFLLYTIVAFFFAAMSGSQWAMFLGLISFLPGVYVFLEGKNWIGASLERKGLTLQGLVEAENFESAELKWFSGQDQIQSRNKENRPMLTTEAPVVRKVPNNAPQSSTDNHEFGLFSQD